MANEQTRVERTRRSHRTRNGGQTAVQSDGQAYADSQTQLAEIDTIISDIVAPSTSAPSAVLGDDQTHDVRTISSEELVRNFRQQSGE